MKRLPVIVILIGLMAAAASGAEKSCDLKFVVVKDDSGKPVRNASVILHPVNGKGGQARGGLQLKTDNEGKTSFDGVPYGKLRIQVLAQGFQTYGDDYVINRPAMEITIKLKRPQSQYSIYEDKDPQPRKDDEQKPPPDQKPQ